MCAQADVDRGYTGRAGLALMAALAPMLAACLVTRLSPGDAGEEPMAHVHAQLPDYQQRPASPVIDDLGIAITLADARVVRGAPVVLHGSYSVDGAFIHRSGDEPLRHALIIVVRRDRPAAQVRAVMRGHALPPPPGGPPPPVNPSVRRGGYFNLDLVAFSEIVDEPGSYWVMAALGDWVSGRLEFEVSRP